MGARGVGFRWGRIWGAGFCGDFGVAGYVSDHSQGAGRGRKLGGPYVGEAHGGGLFPP